MMKPWTANPCPMATARRNPPATVIPPRWRRSVQRLHFLELSTTRSSLRQWADAGARQKAPRGILERMASSSPQMRVPLPGLAWFGHPLLQALAKGPLPRRLPLGQLGSLVTGRSVMGQPVLGQPVLEGQSHWRRNPSAQLRLPASQTRRVRSPLGLLSPRIPGAN